MNTASRPTRLAGAARRHTRTLTVAAVSPLLMIGLGACGSTPQAGGSQSATTLNVGQLGTSEVTKALLEAAGENQTPYTLKHSLYAAGPGLMEAIPSGAVDFGFMADTPPIFAQVAKIPVKIVAVQHQLKDGESQVEVVVPQDSPIRSVADLAGKRVSLTEATIMQYTLARVLEKSVAKYGDITPVNLPPSDVPAAFQGGQIDAAAILDPQRAQLKAQGYRTVATGVGLTSGNEVGVADEAALADSAKSEAIVDYVQRYQRARAWAAANPQQWATAYAKTTGLNPDTAAAVVARENSRPVRITDEVIAGQQLQADTFHRLGLLKEKVDAAQQYDTRFNDRFGPAAPTTGASK